MLNMPKIHHNRFSSKISILLGETKIDDLFAFNECIFPFFVFRFIS